jgi:phytoene/squalene synthetase
LRDLFLYLCNRVLDESVDDIHELELGHKVFGRPEHYDTATDNIVRVHASLLRKRLAEHFQTEGINEPLVVEIPRGNYAPIFRKRDPLPAIPTLRCRKLLSCNRTWL